MHQAHSNTSNSVSYTVDVEQRVDYSEYYFDSTKETMIGLYSKRAYDASKGELVAIESVNDIIWRVAEAVAIAELKYVLSPQELIWIDLDGAKKHQKVKEQARVFADHIGRQIFWANTPANINADAETSLKVLKYWAYGVMAYNKKHESVDVESLESPPELQNILQRERWIWSQTDSILNLDKQPDPNPQVCEFLYKMRDLAQELKGKGTLAACGVAYTNDSLASIQDAARVETLAAKAAMGMGINTSKIRPWSSPVSNGAAASGPDRFYEKTIAQAVDAIAQGGRRGGALIEIRNSNHPDILFFIDKKRLIPKPSFMELYKKYNGDVAKAEYEFGELMIEFDRRQNYLKKTNITVLAMPGFMDAVENKLFYLAEFDGALWNGPLYDPMRPIPGINKLTKEKQYDRYSVDLSQYPEVQHTIIPGDIKDNRFYPKMAYFYAPDVMDRITDGMRTSGEPGFIFWEHVNNSNANNHQYDLDTSNPCLDGDTIVLSKQGYFKIKDLAETFHCVDTWNGKNWVEVDNWRVTATNQPMLEIEFESGGSIKATPYHKFILEDGTRVEARDLKPKDRLMRHDFQVHGKQSVKGAYLKGFLVGDGNLNSSNNPELWLYDEKYTCQQWLLDSASELRASNQTTNTIQDLAFKGFSSNRNAARPASSTTIEDHTRVQLQGLAARKDELIPWCSLYKQALPLTDMLNWSYRSKCEFVAGIFDADGTAQDSATKGFRYQITSISKQLLLQLQTLLISIGVESKLGPKRDGGSKDFGAAKGGIYETQDSYRLTLDQPSSIKLARQVRFSRLQDFSTRKVKHVFKSKFNQIRKISDAGIAEKVYCCTEQENHAFSLVSCVVAQCGEQMLPSGPSKTIPDLNFMGTCNLSSIHAAHPDFFHQNGSSYNWDALTSATRVQQRFMDNVTDVSWYPLADQNTTARLERRNGGGFAGIAEYLSRRNVEFGSEVSQGVVRQLFGHYGYASIEASRQLAQERGVYPLYEGSRLFHQKEPLRNSCLLNNPPTGTLAQLMQTTWGVDPHYGIVFSRKVRGRSVDFTAPGFEDAMRKYGAWQDDQQWQADLVQKIRDNKKSVAGLAEVPEQVQKLFKTRVEVTPMEYIKHLAAIYEVAVDRTQYLIMNSVSNTCSIPLNTPRKDIYEAIVYAYHHHVKALTFYPDSARYSQPIEQAESFEKQVTDLPLLNQRDVSIQETSGRSFKLPIGTPEGTATLHLSLNETAQFPGELVELYLRVGKSGAIESGLCEAIGRLASVFLQYAARFGSKERQFAQDLIIKQLQGIQSGYPHMYKFAEETKARTFASPCDVVAQMISKLYNKNKTTPFNRSVEQTGKSCTCGDELVKIDGCWNCNSCGFSKCG